jgi:hypothetical protein
MFRMPQQAMLILAVVTLATTAGESQAQSVAYKTHGTGVYSPITGAYSGSGEGTHLGAHTFFGNVATSPTDNPLVFNFFSTAPQETIGANGDKLYFTSSGQVTLIPLDATFTTFSAIWTGDFVLVGGTGRFANAGPAAQPLRVIAINDPFSLSDPEWSFTWELSGRIVLH